MARAKSKTLPKSVRERAVRAGRRAKAEVLAQGAAPEVGHRAYRSAYNTVAAAYRYAFDKEFRERNLLAQQKYRASRA